MKQLFDFEEIRPYYDEEVPEVIESLIEEERFQRAVKYVMPDVDFATFAAELKSCKTKRDLQTRLVIPFLIELSKKTTAGLSSSGFVNINKKGSYVFLTNHRDIVLDASFLNVELFRNGLDTCEVAIGDNLLIYPWINQLVRLNKSFIVKRNVSVRQMLEVSRKLSVYINFVIKIKHKSIWIAQRQGRSKDSDDRTQESLIKMLSLGGSSDLLHNIMSLNVAPVSISYEYDPCDYLKAKEFLQRRDNPEFKKAPTDDLNSMQQGLFGYKGRIHFHMTPSVSPQLEPLSDMDDKNEQLALITSIIDRAIHANYYIFPGNYIAYDLFTATKRFENKYTAEEKAHFESYIEKQINKIQDIPDRDDNFLRYKMYEMYYNPLRNYLIANGID